jgi:hypothetical protein
MNRGEGEGVKWMGGKGVGHKWDSGGLEWRMLEVI